MEYLQTPESSVNAFALPTPGTGPIVGGGSRPADRQALRSSFQSLFSPGEHHDLQQPFLVGNVLGPAPPVTPAFSQHHPFPFAAPAASSTTPNSSAFPLSSAVNNNPNDNHLPLYTGLTPFLGPVTPALLNSAALGSHTPFPFSAHFTGFPPSVNINGSPQQVASSPASADHDPASTSPSHLFATSAAGGDPANLSPSSATMIQLTSPYLQAAAKEAVRREFMNMPSYLTAAKTSLCAEKLPLHNSGKSVPDGDNDEHDEVDTAQHIPVSGHVKRTARSTSKNRQPHRSKPAATQAIGLEQTVPGNDHFTPPPLTACESAVTAPEADVAVRRSESPRPVPTIRREVNQEKPSQDKPNAQLCSLQQPFGVPDNTTTAGTAIPIPFMHYPYATYPGMMYMPYPGSQGVAGLHPPPMQGFFMPPPPSEKEKRTNGHGSSKEKVNGAHGSEPRSGSRREKSAHSATRSEQTQPQVHGMWVLGANGPMFVPASMYPFTQPPPSQYAMPAAPHAQNPTTQNAISTSGLSSDGNAATSAVAPTAQVSAPATVETPAQKKERVEQEKQDLICEFKKKTREAAIVRFRQKRRERRFGKLIRYGCRKKLADARPRIKGRFVRVIEGEEDEFLSTGPDIGSPAQVVPEMDMDDEEELAQA